MSTATETPPNLGVLLDMAVDLSVELGGCHMSMRDVLNLTIGSVVQLDKLATAPVDVYVNKKIVARGEVVVVENRFGVKITEIIGKTA
jgi:flagellar motor switch protein FliN/FliY